MTNEPTQKNRKSKGDDLLSKVKAFTKDFKKNEREIIRKYEVQINKLIKDRDNELKKLRKDTDSLVSAISPLASQPIEKTKNASVKAEKKSKVKAKKTGGNKKPKKDEEITSLLQDAFKDTSEFKTEELLKKLDVGYPRFNKYTKSTDSIIVFKGSKKNGAWCLK